MSVLFSWNDHAKIQGKKQSPKADEYFLHSPQTHILEQKKKAAHLILTRWFWWLWGQHEIDHHFHYAKKIVPRVGAAPKSESQNVGTCGNQKHQIRIVHVLGWIDRDYCSPTSHWKKSKSSHSGRMKNLRLPVMKNLILFGWKLPRNAHRIHNFLSPLGNSIFRASLWDKVLGCNVEGFHVLDIEHVKHAKQKAPWPLAYVKKGCSEVRWKANIFESKICRNYLPLATLNGQQPISVVTWPTNREDFDGFCWYDVLDDFPLLPCMGDFENKTHSDQLTSNQWTFWSKLITLIIVNDSLNIHLFYPIFFPQI